MVPRTQAPASPDFPAITDPGRPAPMIVGLGLSASVASMPILQAKRVQERVVFMSKDCGETTLLLDEPLGGDEGDSFPERPDRAIGRVAFEAPVLDEEPESQFRAFEPPPSDRISVPTSADESAVSGPADRGGNEFASSSATTSDGASFSRGLLDTYFRQMGDAAWLSREKEIALAKRIETSQRAMLTALCRVPMLIERIARWGHELAEGRLRLV